MPEESASIYAGLIMPSAWYPLKEAFLIPIEQMGVLFYDSVEEAAVESGKHSAESSLKGIYKIFVKVLSPSYVIKRGTNVFSSYYKPAKIKAESTSKHTAKITVHNFKKEEITIIHRISGWIKRAAEITGATNIETKISESDLDGETVFIIDVNWQ
ncbi:MAG: hypothetical protein U9N85_14175 [Bacteroidota bacterium]|nr:hypothetical protein [Bacteroidota bacterium]